MNTDTSTQPDYPGAFLATLENRRDELKRQLDELARNQKPGVSSERDGFEVLVSLHTYTAICRLIAKLTEVTDP